jgi:hypothetical protein
MGAPREARRRDCYPAAVIVPALFPDFFRVWGGLAPRHSLIPDEVSTGALGDVGWAIRAARCGRFPHPSFLEQNVRMAGFPLPARAAKIPASKLTRLTSATRCTAAPGKQIRPAGLQGDLAARLEALETVKSRS